MLSPIRYSILLVSFCLLTACASTPYGSYHFSLDAQSEEKQWTTKLSSEPGQIKFTAQQQQGSRMQVSLLANRKQQRNPPIKIIISDMDCEVGHQIIIEYFANPNDMYRQYFNTTIPWQSDFTLTLSWDKSGALAVTVADETIATKAYQSFIFARVESIQGVLDVQEFRYTSASTAN